MKTCVAILALFTASMLMLRMSAPTPDPNSKTSARFLGFDSHRTTSDHSQLNKETRAPTQTGNEAVGLFDPKKVEPWYGNYAGPGNYGYATAPVDSVDAAARRHDMAYDKFCVRQPSWGLIECSLADDDLLLGGTALCTVFTDASLSMKGRAAGVVIAGIFLPLAAVKSTVHVDGYISLLNGELGLSLASVLKHSSSLVLNSAEMSDQTHAVVIKVSNSAELLRGRASGQTGSQSDESALIGSPSSNLTTNTVKASGD